MTMSKNIFYEPIPEEYRRPSVRPGALHKVEYASASGGDKHAYVYVPYGYAPEGDTRYDILYIMHGGGGSAADYFGSDEEPNCYKNVLDNMIAKGDMRPVLIAAPSFYPAGDRDPGVENAGALTRDFHRELVEELIPAVENAYRTYAETTDPAGLKASRFHRAFGGFSMGSAATWYTFIQCLDYFAMFLPQSGDCWVIEQMGGRSQPEATAEALAQVVRDSGYMGEDFAIYAATGTKDIAYEALTNQIEAMKKIDDVFLFSDTAGEGNLHYILAEGLYHTGDAACDYLYDVLKRIYPA